MAELRHGDVVHYAYLWWREHLAGEETGRKARPACVMIVVPQGRSARKALLFPVTSSPPGSETAEVAIPETEARRARLCSPAWVIVEEFNSDDPANSPALEHARPLGTFSKRFIATIAAEAARAAPGRGMRAVPRD